MSVLFPKVNKAPTWDYRPIYYDPKKDEMDKKLAALQAKRAAEQKAKGEEPTADANGKPYVPTLHKGSFREAHEAGQSAFRAREERKSKMRMWIIVLCLLLFFVYLLGMM